MARSMNLDAETAFRAVILYTYPGQDPAELQTYTDADGDTYQYHGCEVYGPYAAKGTATAQKNITVNDMYAHGGSGYFSRRYGRPEIVAFVESAKPGWTAV